MKNKIIEIKEDIRLPETSIILEKGDKIKILESLDSSVAMMKINYYEDSININRTGQIALDKIGNTIPHSVVLCDRVIATQTGNEIMIQQTDPILKEAYQVFLSNSTIDLLQNLI